MQQTIYFYFFITFSLFFTASCTFENGDETEAYDILYVSRNGAQMPAHIHGNLASEVFIIVLHGGPGGNGLQYRPGVFSEELEKKYAMVYFDQRGQGMSQGRINSDQITIDEMVEDVKALIRIIEQKYGENNSLFLMGHSWGGTLGTAYMTKDGYQDDFKGWIEVDGAHDFDLIIKSQIPLIKKIGVEQINGENDVDFWKSSIKTAESIDSNDYTLQNLTELNKIGFKAETSLLLAGVINDGTTDHLNLSILAKSFLFTENPITSFISGLFTNYTLVVEHETFSRNLTDQLFKIKIPTLLMWGKYDFVVPEQLGYQAYNLIESKDKNLIIFEHSGHSPMVTEGAKFAQELTIFVENHK